MIMKAFVNLHAFTEKGIDSGSLGMLGMVIHRFDEHGDYRLEVYQGENLKRTIRLKVNKEFKTLQLNIDLAESQKGPQENCHCKTHNSMDLEMAPQGHVVFYVSHGAGGYWVSASKVGEKPVNVFDSRELGDNDIFVANIIRPGTYSLSNALSNAKSKIVVAYPQAGKVRYTPPKALSIEFGQTFKQDVINLEPAQGQIYRIKYKSRIKIELIKADDGPSKKIGVTRWNKLQREPSSQGKQ